MDNYGGLLAERRRKGEKGINFVRYLNAVDVKQNRLNSIATRDKRFESISSIHGPT